MSGLRAAVDAGGMVRCDAFRTCRNGALIRLRLRYRSICAFVRRSVVFLAEIHSLPSRAFPVGGLGAVLNVPVAKGAFR
jgi:hypothetical protein